jgi:hypothetical protein
MALFATSSQAQHWLLPLPGNRVPRSAAAGSDDTAASNVSSSGSGNSLKIDEVAESKSDNIDFDQASKTLPKKRKPEEVDAVATSAGGGDSSSENLEILFIRYCSIIQGEFGPNSNADGKPRRHWRVSATAITFLRRFYLFNSIFDHDPRLIMCVGLMNFSYSLN